MHIETHLLQSSLACYCYPICSYQAYCVNNRQRFGEEEIFRTARETKSFMVFDKDANNNSREPIHGLLYNQYNLITVYDAPSSQNNVLSVTE